MGSMGNGDNLERAFAGATIHDIFNFLTVGILLPVEAATGYLFHLTKAMVSNASPEEGEEWSTPLDKLVGPIVKKIIDDNGDVVKSVAKGGSCADFYPINCTDRFVSDETCQQALISCNGDTNECPVFFNQDASQSEEVVAGAVCFVLAIMILFICLGGLVYTLKKMLMGVSTKIMYKVCDPSSPIR
jgi:sodium-dependent phosphate cotransporter